MKTILLFCPECKEKREIEIRTEKETYPVKNEPIEIDAKVTYCKHCGNQIWNDDVDGDNLKLAFRKYRSAHGLLQPEEIKQIRLKFSLTQIIFSKILGFGDKTIARYETGSIQDDANDKMIRLASFLENFERLLEWSKKELSPAEYRRTMDTLMEFKGRPICTSVALPYRNMQSTYQFDPSIMNCGGSNNGCIIGQ